MFIYNIKLNGNKTFKIFIFLAAIIVAILFIFICYKIFHDSKLQKNNYTIPNLEVYNITSENYANVLKAVHDDLDKYINQKIHFSGYVYRAIDFSDEEFVLARDMIVNYPTSSETLIIGFLCKCDNIKNIPDNTWIEITGTIKKGIYHSEIPIIYITDLKEIEKPSDEYVYPPDDTYIPTAMLM